MNRPTNIGILAGTLTGNRGSEAMVVACIQSIRAAFPCANVHVLSYSPKADLASAKRLEVGLHSITPVTLVFQWLPLALLCYIAPFLVRPTRPNGDNLLGLLSLDAVWDVAGVSFVDFRQKFLPFNCLTLFPFVLLRVPVFKISQSIGPVKRFATRFLARFFLNRVEIVCARGEDTMRHLQMLNLRSRTIVAPDVSFGLGDAGARPLSDRESFLLVAPSSVVAVRSPSYVNKIARLCADCMELGYEVRLLAHSWKHSGGHRNNDLPTCEAVARHVHSLCGRRPPVTGAGLDAAGLRKLIAGSKLLVASRYHALISAIATATPAVSIGWGHKYEEALASVGLASKHVDFERWTPEQAIELVRRTLEEGDRISSRLRMRLPSLLRESRNAMNEICEATRACIDRRRSLPGNA